MFSFWTKFQLKIFFFFLQVATMQCFVVILIYSDTNGQKGLGFINLTLFFQHTVQTNHRVANNVWVCVLSHSTFRNRHFRVRRPEKRDDDKRTIPNRFRIRYECDPKIVFAWFCLCTAHLNNNVKLKQWSINWRQMWTRNNVLQIGIRRIGSVNLTPSRKLVVIEFLRICFIFACVKSTLVYRSSLYLEVMLCSYYHFFSNKGRILTINYSTARTQGSSDERTCHYVYVDCLRFADLCGTLTRQGCRT